MLSFSVNAQSFIETSRNPADFSMLMPGQTATLNFRVEINAPFGNTTNGCTATDMASTMLTGDTDGLTNITFSPVGGGDGCPGAVDDTGGCPTAATTSVNVRMQFTVDGMAMGGNRDLSIDYGYYETATTCSSASQALSVTVLPITLENFEARQREELVELTWTTSLEQNNDFFTIERSFDGKNFEELTTVTGAGDSEELLDYTFTDRTATDVIGAGAVYYRLSQTDYDGSVNVAKIIQVELTGKNAFEVIRVVQSAADMTVDFASPFNSTATIEVFDINGRRVAQKVATTDEGYNTLSLDKSGFVAGMYVLTVTQNGQSLTQKVMVF